MEVKFWKCVVTHCFTNQQQAKVPPAAFSNLLTDTKRPPQQQLLSKLILHSCFTCYCSYERRNSQLANNKRQPPQITHAGGIGGGNGIDTNAAENQSKLASSKKASDHTRSRLQHARSAFRSLFWTLIIMASVGSGGFFLHNNTSEFLNSTVQTTLDGSVPLSEVYFPSVVVCNINQIRKSFFAELGFYENDTLVRIVYEDFIKGTMEEREESRADKDPKREAFYEVIFLSFSIFSFTFSKVMLQHGFFSKRYLIGT